MPGLEPVLRQSVSLTPFLVEQGNPEQFVSFMRSAQRKGKMQGYASNGEAGLHGNVRIKQTGTFVVQSDFR